MMQRYNIFLNYLSYFPNILFITKKALGIFVRYFFCVVIKGLKSVNNLPAPSIVPPFDVRSISCSCLYQMIE